MERECTTQDDVNAAIAAGDMIVVLRGTTCASLYGSASAVLRGSARAVLRGSASAVIYDSASAVAGDTGRALLQSRPVILIGPLGSRDAMLAVYQCADGGQLVRAGCWIGTPDKFEARVAARHGDNQYGREYRAALAMIRALKGDA